MNKLVKSMLIGSMLSISLNADFLMTLTDKDGVEENICVKSYSFSNTLESLHKQDNQIKDVYSTNETLTNKIWMGKPVYRKVFQNLTNFIGDNQWKTIPFNNVNDNVDIVVSAEVSFDNVHENYSMFYSNSNQVRYRIKANGLEYITSQNYIPQNTMATVILEYTKNSEITSVLNNKFIRLINYLPSSSTTGEYLVKPLKNVGIRFLENYTYDESSQNCNAPTN